MGGGRIRHAICRPYLSRPGRALEPGVAGAWAPTRSASASGAAEREGADINLTVCQSDVRTCGLAEPCGYGL